MEAKKNFSKIIGRETMIVRLLDFHRKRYERLGKINSEQHLFLEKILKDKTTSTRQIAKMYAEDFDNTKIDETLGKDWNNFLFN